MAGGKTTLVKRLEEHLLDVHFTYENPYPIVRKRDDLNIDIFTEEGFIANQRLFIEAEIKRYHELPDSKIIFDRGPEDIEFYTLHFPKANGFAWNIEDQLKKELQELRQYRSDMILYLDANEETLQKRMQKDLSRSRKSFHNNMKLFPFERDWYLQFNTKILDVNNRTPEEIEEWTICFLKRNNFL
ncbi:AAA family ATPase [Psychrobacillus vulpis]|uniref:AAA family ATPase n=1 Tax=Psychrobacillus vulpis TaxID=2325572 RepID=UPI001F10BCEF|nr:AAA family ATPase [Psychrobacillus vulpis]